ncbi:MAG TPA: hypothetical protein VEK06_03965, partial [Myxococcota bacterium]|nr:hypothetical protein [Myxococcota bacterium]
MDFYQIDRKLTAFEPFLNQLDQDQVMTRLWNKDPSLFVGKTLMLDWLNEPEKELKSLPHLIAVKDKALKTSCKAIVLLGMGGSSLATRVFHECLKSSSRPFFVFDTIHPSAIYRLEQQIDIPSTLFIVASKSGSTLEPNLLYHHFLSRLQEAKVSDPFRHFMAITDPISPLEQLSVENGFLEGAFGEPNIGGRYSALSAFGILPSLLMDIDARTVLERALTMAKLSGPSTPIRKNPGGHLGAFLGHNALSGRIKIKFFFSPSLKPLGSWLEQLLAESLGKDQKGIIPIVSNDEKLLDPASSMHCFIELVDEIGYVDQKNILKERENSFASLELLDRFDLGAEMFRWEVAVALAGSIIGVNPFDQPNVEKSKERARAIMDNWDAKQHEQKEDSESSTIAFKAMINAAKNASFTAILSYLDENEANSALLEKLAMSIGQQINKPVIVQTGPRYLHSTGQLFKGGANVGCFLIITGPYEHNFPSDIKGLTFKDIHLSQALGDFEAMSSAARKIWRIHLTDVKEEITG